MKRKYHILPFILLGFSTILLASPPNPPKNIGLTYVDPSTIRLSFMDNSENESGFYIYVDDVQKYRLNAHKSTYLYQTIPRLSCDQRHTISIEAFNSEGRSTKVSKSFTFQGTFGKPCSPFLDLDTEHEHITINKQDILLNKYPSHYPFIANVQTPLSCEWRLNGGYYAGPDCNEIIAQDMHYELHAQGLKIGENNLSLTLTDNNGNSVTDYLLIEVIDDVQELIYIGVKKLTLKVGQTVIIPAGVTRICLDYGCLPSSHYWSGGLGSFNDSMFELGHLFPGQGYTASTTYTAQEEGNTTLTLSALGSSQSISVEILLPHRVVVDGNLMWQESLKEVRKAWSFVPLNPTITQGDTATTYCENLIWAGHDDWRIPTINELLEYVGLNSEEEYWGLLTSPIPYSKFQLITSSSLRDVQGDEELLVKCVREIKE